MSEAFQTEFEFELPTGFVDEVGKRHRMGAMRMAIAADEVLPLNDPRVMANPAYLSIILLTRVITRLGDLDQITTHTVEHLFSADFEFLNQLYDHLNRKMDPDNPQDKMRSSGKSA